MPEIVMCTSTCALGIVYTMSDGTAWHADLAGEQHRICADLEWTAIACSSNGIMVLAHYDKRFVRVHDMNTGIDTDIPGACASAFPAVAISSDGAQFAITGNGDVVDIWDIGAKQRVRRIWNARPTVMKWNPTRPLLLMSTHIHDSFLWGPLRPVYNTDTGTVAYQLPHNNGYEWSADGSQIANKSWREVTIRNADDGKIIGALNGGDTRGLVMCTPRPDLVAWYWSDTASYREEIQVWAVCGTRLKQMVVNHACDNYVQAMVWGKEPESLVYLTGCGEVRTIGWGESRRRASTRNLVPMMDNPEALLRKPRVPA